MNEHKLDLIKKRWTNLIKIAEKVCFQWIATVSKWRRNVTWKLKERNNAADIIKPRNYI